MKICWFGLYVSIIFFVSNSIAASYIAPETVKSKINSYRGYNELTTAADGMDIDKYTYNLTTWQIYNGGFYKAMADKYKNPYSNGNKSEWRAKDGGDIATIDNDATIQEMRLLAERYKLTTNSNYKTTFKNSFNKALNFLFTMQRNNGGIPQVWPKRGNYSDQITLNDNAMIRVMVLLMDISNSESPFDSDIIDDNTRLKTKESLNKAIDFLLKAQIKNNGILTVWCAQHDTSTMAPVGARAYELPSKSGSESAGAVWFLMNWPEQTESIQNAVKSAIAWYKKTKVVGLYFNKKKGVFEQREGNPLWYRFYEVDNDNYFFCDREGISSKTQDFTKISEERRTGYQWAGEYGSALINTESAYLSALEKMNFTEESSSSILQSSSSEESSSSVISDTTISLCDSSNCNDIFQGLKFLNNINLSSKSFIQVYDIKGNVIIKNYSTEAVSGLKILNAGIYFVIVRNKNQIILQKRVRIIK